MAGAFRGPLVTSLALRLESRHNLRRMISTDVKFEVLAGRAAELAFLRERVTKAAGGEGSVTLILGEAGLGKSRLVAELQKSAGHEIPRLLVAECLEHARVPLQPFLAIVAATRADLLSLADSCAEISDVILQRLHATSAHSLPHIVAIEDVQWADDMTLQTIEYLGCHVESLPLCLLITCRSDVMRDDPRIGAALSALQRRGARAVYLEPLSEIDTRFLLNSLLRQNHGLSTVEIDHIQDLSGGNPLYLQELIRDAIDQRQTGAAVVADRVPSSLKVGVLERLRGLASSTRQTLLEAAVLGVEFDLQLLSLLCGHGFTGAVDALQQAVEAKFLTEISSDGRYRFRHPLIRQALYSELTTPAAIALHQRAAQALEHRVGSRHRLAELAYHASAASNAKTAFRYNEAAGDAAMLSYSYRDAIRFFRATVRFAPRSQSRLGEVNGKLAYALYCDGRLDEAKTYFRAAIDGHVHAKSFKPAFWLIDLLYSVYWHDGDAIGGLEFAAMIVRIAEHNGDRDVKDSLLIRTASYLNVLDMPCQAEELLGRIGQTESNLGVSSRIRLHELRAIALVGTGCFSEAIREFELALDISQANQVYLETTKVTGNFATCYRLMGDLDGAERLARYALRCAEAQHLGLVHQCCRTIELAEILFLKGRLQEAAELSFPALANGIVLNGMQIKAASVIIPIALAMMREDLLSYFDEDSIVAQAFATRMISHIASMTDAIVPLYLHRGRSEDAQVLLHRAMTCAAAPDPFALDMLVRVGKHGVTSDVPKARELLLQICARRPQLIGKAYVAYFDAVVARRERSWERHKRLAATAAASFAELGIPMFQADALELGGRQRDALTIYRRIGAAGHAARLEQMFSDRGHRGGRLTRRQQQIGKLIAAGASNRDVAGRLHISEKTLANHLTGIYRRLNIDSRGALVEYLTRYPT